MFQYIMLGDWLPREPNLQDGTEFQKVNRNIKVNKMDSLKRHNL